MEQDELIVGARQAQQKCPVRKECALTDDSRRVLVKRTPELRDYALLVETVLDKLP